MEQKVSLITTIKNEEKMLHLFLDSIIKQQKQPDEVIIVDAGSTDGTLEILKQYKKKIKKLTIIEKKGNRSKGRNAAIKASKYPIIAVTDAGCILDKRWLINITLPFTQKDVAVVAGFYKPKTHSIFEKCLAAYTCVMPDKFNPLSFLPSSRSVAFRKSAWRRVGGYPQNLDTCEDLVFDRKLIRDGLTFATQPSAFVYWPQRKNILQAAAQFFNYAKGDGFARYFRFTTPFLFGRYAVGIAFLAYGLYFKNALVTGICISLFVLYLAWAIGKNYRYVRNTQAFFYLPLLQLTSDAAVISGTIIGFVQGIWAIKNKS